MLLLLFLHQVTPRLASAVVVFKSNLNTFIKFQRLISGTVDGEQFVAVIFYVNCVNMCLNEFFGAALFLL